MTFLLELLLKLCDLACWLCTQRDGWQRRLSAERDITWTKKNAQPKR